jgi:hypothetical protein
MGRIIIPGQFIDGSDDTFPDVLDDGPELELPDEVLTPDQCAMILLDRLAFLRAKGRTEVRALLLSCAEQLISLQEFHVASSMLELVNIRDHELDALASGGLHEFMVQAGEADHWPQACRGCGCTNEQGCPGGCLWIDPDLCSTCFNKMFPMQADGDGRSTAPETAGVFKEIPMATADTDPPRQPPKALNQLVDFLRAHPRVRVTNLDGSIETRTFHGPDRHAHGLWFTRDGLDAFVEESAMAFLPVACTQTEGAATAESGVTLDESGFTLEKFGRKIRVDYLPAEA